VKYRFSLAKEMFFSFCVCVVMMTPSSQTNQFYFRRFALLAIKVADNVIWGFFVGMEGESAFTSCKGQGSCEE